MSNGRFQFRLTDLIAATALVAAILASAAYLPSTYKTDGLAGPFVLAPAIVLAWIVGGVCFCFRRLRVPAIVVTLLVCAAFSLRQARFAERLRLLEVEVPRIVEYVEKYRAKHEGECPDDLSGYNFQRPELRTHIRYVPPRLYDPLTRLNESPYAIQYHPNARSDHWRWYTTSGGYWYDDD